MKCKKVVDFLTDYLEGDLEQEVTIAFEGHIDDCPGCLSFVNTFKTTVDLAKDIRYEEIPEEMKERLHSFIEKHYSTPSEE